MAVHILAVDDSDGESWMEVLEGSPGPTVQNSRASSISALGEAADHTGHAISADEDESWASDFDSMTDCNPGHDAIPSTANNEPVLLHDHTKHGSVDSVSNQHLCLERPEIGDIAWHLREVESIIKDQPEKAFYYRSWLGWMYRMQLSEIQDIVHHAPDPIIQLVNCLFGLQNHPFWKARDTYLNQWYAMYHACVDTYNMWQTQRRLHNTGGGRGNGEIGKPEHALPQNSARARARRHPSFNDSSITSDTPSSASQSHHPYSAPYRPIIATLADTSDCVSLLPWILGDLFNFLNKTHRSIDGRSLDEVGQRVISFQTWIQWVRQANAQSAGCDSNSTSTAPLPDLVGNHVEFVKSYIKSIGLPLEAANYCHFVAEDA